MGVPCVFGAVKVEEGKPNKKEEAKKKYVRAITGNAALTKFCHVLCFFF